MNFSYNLQGLAPLLRELEELLDVPLEELYIHTHEVDLLRDVYDRELYPTLVGRPVNTEPSAIVTEVKNSLILAVVERGFHSLEAVLTARLLYHGRSLVLHQIYVHSLGDGNTRPAKQ